MTSTLPSRNARSRAVLAAFLLAALVPASCGRSGESAGEGAGGGEVKVSTAVFAADCCTPGQHTACQDGRWCNGEEQCDCWGNCEVGAPVNCDDGDMCTDDSCVDDVVVAPGAGVGTGHCQHVCIPGPTCVCPECTVPADCDDGDACTDDACVDNMCQYGDTNCDDGNYCTDDTCDSSTGCQHTVRPDCCTTAADCDDTIACTVDDCVLSTHTCTHTLLDGWCEIAGICYADGTVNPANECESCQYLYQPDRWTGLPTGTPCEDSLYCTLDQACDGDGRCVGAGTPCTDDGLTCTETVCNEATDSCFSRVYDGFCLIGGVCYVNGNENPANDCQRCWSTTSKTAWSPLAAGTACDDSLYCTETDTCDGAGACVGTVNPCDVEVVECTDNICNEATDSCSYPPSVNRCYIAGTCYTNGDIDAPPNNCQWCFTATSQTAWTNRPNGANCDVDGLFCTGVNQCDGAGTCAVFPPPCNAPAPQCTTATCNEVTDTCGYTINDNACYIGATCYVENDNNPAAFCQWCKHDTSQTAWTNKAAGTACDDGLWCNVTDTCNGTGSCVGAGFTCDDITPCTTDTCNEAADTCTNATNPGSCLIDGACYADGDSNPVNRCQWCQSATSNSTWTNKPAGTNCDVDGLFCTGVDLCDGAGTCNAAPPPCTAPAACTNLTCDDVTDTCGYTINPGSCYIGATCYADGDEIVVDGCQWCQSLSSQTAWTNKAPGSVCSDTLFCTQGDQCDGSGSCMSGGPNCVDTIACTDNNCNESTNTCSNPISASRCYIGGICYTDGDENLPAFICQWCQHAASDSAWTNKPNGTSCDTDGLFCNGVDLCDGAGTCNDAPDPCVAPNPMCTAATCDEPSNTCGYTIDAGECYIGGACYIDNDNHPTNVCQRCWSATTQAGWSTRPDGPVAGCTGAIDQCNNRSCIGGACGAVANTGAPCTYLPDVCHDPGACLADGTCGAGPHVYPTNDACPNTIAVAIDGSVSGSTLCAVNDYAGSCGGGSAPDLVYEFTIPVSNDYQLYAHNVIHASPFDGLVYVRNACTDAGSVYCNDDCTNGRFLTCASYGLDATDAGFMIPVMPSDQSKRWYLFADGWDSSSYGDFTLTVDRVNYTNNSCSTLEDTDYVVDATNGGTFRGNISGYTNTFICPIDGRYLGNKCDCYSGDTLCANGNNTQGTSAQPARAFFKVVPPAGGNYCIRTNESIPGAFDAVIDAWRLVEADGSTDGHTCDHNPRAMQTGTTPNGGCHYGAGAANAQLQLNSVGAGETIIVGISPYCGGVEVNYEVQFTIGTCI